MTPSTLKTITLPRSEYRYVPASYEPCGNDLELEASILRGRPYNRATGQRQAFADMPKPHPVALFVAILFYVSSVPLLCYGTVRLVSWAML